MKRKSYIIKNLSVKLLLTYIAIWFISIVLSYLISLAFLPPFIVEYIQSSISPEIRNGIDFFYGTALSSGLGISTILIVLINKKLLQPMRELSEAAHRVSRGEFDIQVPINENKKDELSILIANFNTMAKELSSVNMLNNSFISNMSHEFRTPISSIQGFATVLYNSDLSEEQKEYAKIIMDESARLSGLATNILKLTKLENQNIITDKQDFLLDEQIRHTILLLQNEWQKKSITINVELSEIPYYGNAELLQQIWLNLFSNAVKFTDNNGEINIGSKMVRTDDHMLIVQISVRDDGIGMDEQTIGHIFDKFYQGNTEQTNEGNGLGLALVKRIVELCGGEIKVKSELGAYSEFVVLLPLMADL